MAVLSPYGQEILNGANIVAVLEEMGRRRRPWKDREEVLGHFGKKKKEAVRAYRQFIMDGFHMGRRDDLIGGCLKRSAGGWEGVRELHRSNEYWRGDERILGDGAFVVRILKAAEEELSSKEKLRRGNKAGT